jgi:NAD-dependent SIR2 family protein deacetylase
MKVETYMSSKPPGVLDKLYCNRCKKNLTLRDITLEDNKIKCKKCGLVVLEVNG